MNSTVVPTGFLHLNSPLADLNVAEAIQSIIVLIIERANFTSGIMLGVSLTFLIVWVATFGSRRESALRMALDFEREKELHYQLHIKDERNNRLHARIDGIVIS